MTKVVFRNTSSGAIVKQVDYEYDAYNRLVRRTFDADGAGAGAATNQYWVYDEGINAVLQFDGSSASNLSHRYLWSDNVDELLADEQIAGNNTLWGLADHLGSLRDIADYSESTGVTTIANHRTLNSFGKLVSETNAAVDMLFAFTGKQFDEATGLQHNLFRWLDPSLGQWLSEDPIGFSAGDENVRRYVGNGVIAKTDNLGLYGDPGDTQGTQYTDPKYQSFMSSLWNSAVAWNQAYYGLMLEAQATITGNSETLLEAREQYIQAYHMGPQGQVDEARRQRETAESAAYQYATHSALYTSAAVTAAASAMVASGVDATFYGLTTLRINLNNAHFVGMVLRRQLAQHQQIVAVMNRMQSISGIQVERCAQAALQSSGRMATVYHNMMLRAQIAHRIHYSLYLRAMVDYSVRYRILFPAP